MLGVNICNLDLQAVDNRWSRLYGEKSCTVFLKNLNFFSTEERKTWIYWM